MSNRSRSKQRDTSTCHCQILGQHKNMEFLFKKIDLFSNHHKLVLRRSFWIFFDVLRSWDDVFSDVFGFVLCWRGSFRLVPQRFLSSSDIYDWLRIPSENITISGSVPGSRFGYHITFIPSHYFHRPSHHKWNPHPKVAETQSYWSCPPDSWENSTCHLWEPLGTRIRNHRVKSESDE